MIQVFHSFKQLIKSFNLFTFPVNLRYQLQPDYNTFQGGLASIVLIVLIVSVFFSSWIDLLNKSDISSKTSIIRQFDPVHSQFNTNDFMFAIGVKGINLSNFSQNKYFDLKMSRIQKIKGENVETNQYPFTLVPCTTDHWSHLGQGFIQTYKRQELNQFLCPQKNISISVGGKWTSQKFSYLKISFKKCLESNCKTQEELMQWIHNKAQFNFDFFYTNVLLNPDQSQPFQMFLQDKDYSIFSPTLGTTTNVYLAQYIMQTDQSIFPWAQKSINKGYMINRSEKEVINFSPGPHDAFCQLYLRKSNVQLRIQRKFRKLDDMLSYIGGLFGIMAIAFGVIMKYYGQCSFELEMCQKIFDYNSRKHFKETKSDNCEQQIGISPNLISSNILKFNLKSEKTIKQNVNETQNAIEPRDFGFLDFFLHILVYIPLRKLCNIKWKRMKLYEESLEEMRQKLDIGHLMEKLSFYDRSINALFDESQLKLLYLQEKFNFHDVRNERKMFNLRDSLVQNLFGQRQQTNEGSLGLFSENKNIRRRNGQYVQGFIDGKQLLRNSSLKKSKNCNQPVESENKKMSLLQIYKALGKLEEKIEKGDTISTRIFNSLQNELLEAYEKNKINKTREELVPNKMVSFRVRNKELKKKTREKMSSQVKELPDQMACPSLMPVCPLHEQNEGEISASQG